MVTYDEIGGYPHPDHLRTHAISIEAYEKSGDPNAYPGTGEPWEISKLYYDRAFNPEKIRAVHNAMLESDMDSPYADRLDWYDRVAAGEDDPDAWRLTHHEVTTQVKTDAFLDYRDAALRAHRSQADTHGGFFFTPNELLRKHWPWEDYVLIDSKVQTSTPENDILARLTDTPLYERHHALHDFIHCGHHRCARSPATRRTPRRRRHPVCFRVPGNVCIRAGSDRGVPHYDPADPSRQTAFHNCRRHACRTQPTAPGPQGS